MENLNSKKSLRAVHILRIIKWVVFVNDYEIEKFNNEKGKIDDCLPDSGSFKFN